MTNQPLNNNDLTKIVIFILLLLPTVFFIVGIIPVLFLAFGIFMLNKSNDFSHIETAVRNYKYYIWTCLTGYILLSLFAGVAVGNVREGIIFGLFSAAIACFYLVIIDKLFLSLLEPHADWVAANGIFSGKNRTTDTKFNRDGLDSFSVADELNKWAKLKEAGHITQQEFDDVRKKLLQKN